MSQSTARRARAAAIASAAVTAGLLVPSAAHADVTTTSITSPAPETIFDTDFGFLSGGGGGGAGDAMTVTGLAPGADDGDEVRIVCSYTLNGVTILTALDESGGGGDEIATVTGGAFSADGVTAPALPCRLRAVPIDTDDTLPESADLSAFAGPRLIGGGFQLLEDTPSGPGPQTFVTERGQSKGLTATYGLGAGGLGGGFGGFSGGVFLTALLDDTYYRPLFGPSAFLSGLGLFGGGSSSISDLGLIVDGRSATTSPSVGDQVSRVVSRTFDPATADQTIVEEAPIASVVLDGDGNPTGVEPSGLKVRRTVAQNGEGRRIAVSDDFISTDGAAHHVETRYLQSLYTALYGGAYPGSIKEPASFRFPWATGDSYIEPEVGKDYGPAPAGATTIWVHGARQDFSDVFDPPTRAAKRAAEIPRAEGAISFDSAPSNVKFLDDGVFVANFVRDVPAGGSAGVSQTLLQALTPGDLQNLVTPPAAPSNVPPAPAAAPLPTQPPVLPDATLFDPLPILAKSTGKVLLTPAQGRRLRDRKPVTVTTKGMPAGRYGVTIRRRVPHGKTLASGIRTIKTDGVLKVTLRLTKYGKKYLAQKKTRKAKSVPVRVIVTWTPPGHGRQRKQTSYPANFR